MINPRDLRSNFVKYRCSKTREMEFADKIMSSNQAEALMPLPLKKVKTTFKTFVKILGALVNPKGIHT